MKSLTTVPFFKLAGTGNDFIIFDELKQDLHSTLFSSQDFANKTKFISDLCARHTGIGADGLIFLKPSSDHHFEWEFFNSDGSTAEMCGNAARCVARLVFELGYYYQYIKFKTLAGTVECAQEDDGTISVLMPVQEPFEYKEIKITNISGVFVNTGVPHFVFQTHKDFILEKDVARTIRHAPEFQPTGTNVTLVTKLGDYHLKSVTYERGVEEYTLACGTGAVAAALVAWPNPNKEIQVSVPGGELFVSKAKDRKPKLRGSTKFLFSGKLNVGDFYEKI